MRMMATNCPYQVALYIYHCLQEYWSTISLTEEETTGQRPVWGQCRVLPVDLSLALSSTGDSLSQERTEGGLQNIFLLYTFTAEVETVMAENNLRARKTRSE